MSASQDKPLEFAGIVAARMNESHLRKAEELGINLADKMLSIGNCLFPLSTCVNRMTKLCDGRKQSIHFMYNFVPLD